MEKKIGNNQALVLVVGIASITAIEIYALARGIDGTLLALTIAIIAGILGYKVELPLLITPKKEEREGGL